MSKVFGNFIILTPTKARINWGKTELTPIEYYCDNLNSLTFTFLVCSKNIYVIPSFVEVTYLRHASAIIVDYDALQSLYCSFPYSCLVELHTALNE